MKALSVHQPWAWAILHAGKAVENRTWPTRYRGPLFIHSSKSRRSSDAWPAAAWRERFGVERPPWAERSRPAKRLMASTPLSSCPSSLHG